MEFLNYHHLRYCWMVAREGGLTKAAAKLYVSQPTISAQISALEGVLGEKLFRRTGRNLRLTDVGQNVLELCGGDFFHRAGSVKFGQATANLTSAATALGRC